MAQIASETSTEVRQLLDAADANVQVYRAQAFTSALPKPDSAGDAQLNMILQATPPAKRQEAALSLAKGNDAVAASLCSGFGKQLLAAYGMPDVIHSTAQLYAVEAARTSSDSRRSQAAERYFNSAELSKAVDAARMAASNAEGVFNSLAVKASYDSRDSEIARLRQMVATQRGHSL